ncbi:hypothetical protein D3C86_1117860 [compost metagenome]
MKQVILCGIIPPVRCGVCTGCVGVCRHSSPAFGATHQAGNYRAVQGIISGQHPFILAAQVTILAQHQAVSLIVDHIFYGFAGDLLFDQAATIIIKVGIADAIYLVGGRYGPVVIKGIGSSCTIAAIAYRKLRIGGSRR